MSEEKKMFVVIERHPNGIGPHWVGKIGNEKQTREFLKKELLDYIYAVFEMKEDGLDVTNDFLIQDKETFDFVGVK